MQVLLWRHILCCNNHMNNILLINFKNISVLFTFNLHFELFKYQGNLIYTHSFIQQTTTHGSCACAWKISAWLPSQPTTTPSDLHLRWLSTKRNSARVFRLSRKQWRVCEEEAFLAQSIAISFNHVNHFYA